MRLDGTSACLTIEGATNTEVFQAYVREVLTPSLRSGDIVIMDNLGAHKTTGPWRSSPKPEPRSVFRRHTHPISTSSK